MQHTIAIAALMLAAFCLTGCHVDEDKQGDGKNVKIETPFGGMQVKTDHDGVIAGIGLPVYPGAVAVKKNGNAGDDGDNGSADVNMSFGSFQLKVKAISYQTDDSPQQVFDFYRKALGRYGTVIQCRNDRPVGTPIRTNEGLTCEDNGHQHPGDNESDTPPADAHASKNGVAPFDGSARIQLKAGSKKHQHIVDINPRSGGAGFGLVSLDLPTDFSFGDKSDKSDKDDKQ